MTKPDRPDREFAQEWAWCLRTALRILRDRDDAEDAVQEVFRKLPYDRFVRLSDKERRAYLYRALCNEANRNQRRASRRSPLADLPEAALVSDDPSPEEETIRAEIRHHVRAMIDELPARCREVMRLAVYEQRIQPEIAAKLGIGVNAVQKQVARAYRRLREMPQAAYLADFGVSKKVDGGGTHG